MRRVRSRGPALYPIRVLAGAGIIYGIASVVGGSGSSPRSSRASCSATLPRRARARSRASSRRSPARRDRRVRRARADHRGRRPGSPTLWADGIVLALLLAFVARPLAVSRSSSGAAHVGRARLHRVGWAEGCRPHPARRARAPRGVDDAAQLYGIVFVVVLFSVVVQGASVPYVAERFRIPFRRVDHDLAEVVEFVVRDDAFASGRRLGELPLGERAWVGVLIRDGRPQAIAGASSSAGRSGPRLLPTRGRSRLAVAGSAWTVRSPKFPSPPDGRPAAAGVSVSRTCRRPRPLFRPRRPAFFIATMRGGGAMRARGASRTEPPRHGRGRRSRRGRRGCTVPSATRLPRSSPCPGPPA